MTLSRHLIPLVERLQTASIACVGDLMLDHFIYGDVNRISPEAPIPVLRIRSQKSMLGGLGNVVRNLGALGCQMKVFSVAGEDASAGEIQMLLNQIARCDSHLVREAGRTTPVKLRYVAAGQQLLRADQETTHPIAAASLQALLKNFASSIADCSVVILSDYGKGVLVHSLAAEFIQIARAQGKQIVVDPKGSDFARYRHVTIIKPNLKELAEATAASVAGAAAQESAARQLIQQTEAEFILITRGPDGMLLVPRAGEAHELPSVAREVFDVSGAGDTVAATLAAGLASGASVIDAVNMANIAAGLVVAKAGTAVVERAEIIHAIESQSAAGANEKLLSLNQLSERSALWQRMGLKIGLLFGSMQTISPMEMEALESARKACDRLIVAIPSDAAMAGLADQQARAHLAASTVFADAVIIIDEPHLEGISALLQPSTVSLLPS